jgi:hypothetical protein
MMLKMERKLQVIQDNAALAAKVKGFDLPTRIFVLKTDK